MVVGFAQQVCLDVVVVVKLAVDYGVDRVVCRVKGLSAIGGEIVDC